MDGSSYSATARSARRSFIALLMLLIGLVGGLVVLWKVLIPATKSTAVAVEQAPPPPEPPPLFKLEYGWEQIEKVNNPWMAIVRLPTGERILITTKYYGQMVGLSTLLLPPLPAPTLEKK